MLILYTSKVILRIQCWAYQIWDMFLSVLYFSKRIQVVFDIFHFSTSYNNRIRIQYLHNIDPNHIISCNVNNFHLHSSNNHNLYHFRTLPNCMYSTCTRIRMIRLLRRSVYLKIMKLIILLLQFMIWIKTTTFVDSFIVFFITDLWLTLGITMSIISFARNMVAHSVNFCWTPVGIFIEINKC